MTIEPVVSRITIYPVKSLDGMVLQKAMVTDGGCLLHDREYAMSDDEGNFITGKTNSAVHSLRSTVDIENEIISFKPQLGTTWSKFYLQKEKPAIEAYLADYFGVPTLLNQNKTGRFMDIPDISGVTIVSTATLKAVSEWYNHMDLEQTRKRFRTTIEIDGVPAFWEDHLFFKGGGVIEFKIGEVTMFGMSPRARCVVPTRNPETGEVTNAFPKTFARHRAASLPLWSTLEEYGHYYYLTVDCQIPAAETGNWIVTGNALKIIGEKALY